MGMRTMIAIYTQMGLIPENKREGAAIAAELGGEYLNDSDRFMHNQFGWPLTDIKAWDEQGLWNWPSPNEVAL